MNYGQERFGHQRVASSSRFRVKGSACWVAAERINRDYDESRTSDERNTEHAPSGPKSRIPEAKAQYRPPALAGQERPSIATQPERPIAEDRNQKERARSKEACGLPEEFQNSTQEQRETEQCEQYCET
jgi:hypothetical protein